MSVFEKAKKYFMTKRQELVLSKWVETDSKWQGGDGYRYRTWRSPDGSREITERICDGEKYEGWVMKDIWLDVRSDMVNANMMRVQSVWKPGATEPEYNVYVNAIQGEDGNGWLLADVCYYGMNGGEMTEPHSWSAPMKIGEFSQLSDEEFDKLCSDWLSGEGVYSLSEIKAIGDIDIVKTVAAFREQIENFDFSRPALVPKEEEELLLN